MMLDANVFFPLSSSRERAKGAQARAGSSA
jgi:hypothetical protein